ncbi:MAG: amidohydrolase family protein, partial [Deltaproteobacteria bacterium]|nr:amidohydrolase family protein [Deltaproteobacteria bacterium]
MDVGRPLYLDRVAIDFPELRIVASCGGWPWVPELVGVARRHQNVYIDTSSHRPKYLAMPGSGFEMLMQFGNTLLQDQIVFASGSGDLGLSIGQIVKEMKELPLKDEVKEKWLYKNALQL